jgi:hypothetical protein
LGFDKAGYSRVKSEKTALDEKELYVLPKTRNEQYDMMENHQPSCGQFIWKRIKMATVKL